MKIKYVTQIQNNKVITSGIFGKSYKYSDDSELAEIVDRLIDEGFCFVDEPAGWPPAAVLKTLQEKKLLNKSFTAITWSGPNQYRTYQVEVERLPMKVVGEECWSWMLFEETNSLYLSVACGSVGLFTRNIALNEEEKRNYESEGFEFIKRLSEKIRMNPNDFTKRHIKCFDDLENTKEAAATWRFQHDRKP